MKTTNEKARIAKALGITVEALDAAEDHVARKIGSVLISTDGARKAHGSFVSEGGLWAKGRRVWHEMIGADCSGSPEEIVARLFPGCECDVRTDYAGTWIAALTPKAAA